MPAPAAGVQLDQDTAEFVAGVTSIAISTRDAQLVPSVGKALGCLVGADRRRLTVFVDRAQSAQVVADMVAGSPVAVVVSLPATHRTVQIKGPRVTIAPATAAQRVGVGQQVDAIVEHLAERGYSEPVLRAFFGYSPEALLAVRFAPAAVFAQTPGPRAGERITG